MRVGILTFHCAHNYGAVLQAFALQEFLRSSGYDVEIIDYRPEYLISPYNDISMDLTQLGNIVRLPLQPMRRLRRKRFSAFITEKLRLSPSSATATFVSHDYDAYVLGSDQIWNPTITNGDGVFFGRFGRPSNSRLISYAASSEASYEGETLDLSPQQMHLREFSSISVREELLREQIQPLVDIPVETVLDPTLLVDPTVFERIAGDTKSSGHLLIYQVKRDSKTTSVARRVKQITGIANAVRLTPGVSKLDIANIYSAASPGDFVSLFMSCGYVVTTSFHGAVFSIIFRKQFVCVMDRSRGNYRISSLLAKLGLSNRMVYAPGDIPRDPIDYDKVYKNIEMLRNSSRAFLINALLS